MTLQVGGSILVFTDTELEPPPSHAAHIKSGSWLRTDSSSMGQSGYKVINLPCCLLIIQPWLSTPLPPEKCCYFLRMSRKGGTMAECLPADTCSYPCSELIAHLKVKSSGVTKPQLLCLWFLLLLE